jgi:RNA polymerase sigma factor (sigma-70 family)
MTAFSDSDLPADVLAKARTGDVAAQDAIYRAFARPVRTLARRLVPGAATAEDVAQDVFIDVLTRLDQYDHRGSFAGWVRSITVHRCLMHLRSPWRRGLGWVESLRAADPEAGSERPAVARAATAVPIDTLESQVQWLDHQLSIAGSRLPARQAEQLWRDRVEVMNSLVQLRYVEAQGPVP